MNDRQLEPMDADQAERIKKKLRKLDVAIDGIACRTTRHALSEHIAAMHRLVCKNEEARND